MNGSRILVIGGGMGMAVGRALAADLFRTTPEQPGLKTVLIEPDEPIQDHNAKGLTSYQRRVAKKYDKEHRASELAWAFVDKYRVCHAREQRMAMSNEFKRTIRRGKLPGYPSTRMHELLRIAG